MDNETHLAAPPAVERGLSIETAPRDGTRILGWIERTAEYEIVRWEMPHERAGARAWCLNEYSEPYMSKIAIEPPSRWWPLPPTLRPSDREEGKEGNVRERVTHLLLDYKWSPKSSGEIKAEHETDECSGALWDKAFAVADAILALSGSLAPANPTEKE